jgi:triosephosphate isomerase (TIM)
LSPTVKSSGDSIRPIVIGNWKMNGLKAALAEAIAVKDSLAVGFMPADVMICPPASLVMILAEVLKGSQVLVGGQDCHAASSGAFTGDVSAQMLKDAGAGGVIVGHSERRMGHGERDRDVLAKVEAAHVAGLQAIVCVGETAGERAAGLTHVVVRRQLAGSLPSGATAANTLVAYEPVWAIGTGLTPTVDDVAAVHATVLEALGQRFAADAHAMRLLYGGSVKPSNARELMAVPNVHGALVGGASLKAVDFLGILAAFDRADA